ncbi:MAG TPA: DUF3750 domain-containing protein [Kofleriaceae bacterium]
MRFAVLLAVAGAGLGGCVLMKKSLDMPGNDETTVALLTGGLGHPMDGIARHPWFAVRMRGETEWQIFEVGGGGTESDPFHKHTPYVDPIVHKIWRGEAGERAAECVKRVGPDVKSYIESHYIFYPGPNSNTFGDVVLRRCKLSAALPSTSVGKDWRGMIGAGITSERTGVQLETPVVGVKVGLKEGVEVHVIGLSFGIDLWPPAIILPLGPGRLGFADR